jgi:hypothetical protein
MDIRAWRHNSTPQLSGGGVADVGAWRRDAERRLGSQPGGDRDGRRDIRVVKDLVELRPENLTQPEAGCTCLGAVERTPDIKSPKLMCGSCHSRILRALTSGASKNLGQLWISVDRSQRRASDPFRHIGGKRTHQGVITRALATFWWETHPTEPYAESRGYFRPCILTAWMDAAAASGSR